jgi:hypothetical protein
MPAPQWTGVEPAPPPRQRKSEAVEAAIRLRGLATPLRLIDTATNTNPVSVAAAPACTEKNVCHSARGGIGDCAILPRPPEVDRKACWAVSVAAVVLTPLSETAPFQPSNLAPLSPQVLYFQSNKVLLSKDSCALST